MPYHDGMLSFPVVTEFDETLVLVGLELAQIERPSATGVAQALAVAALAAQRIDGRAFLDLRRVGSRSDRGRCGKRTGEPQQP